MILLNGFANSTITCSVIREVDLDALNLLASGENKALCACSYRGDKGHHYFTYHTESMVPFAQFHASAEFEDALAILASALPIVKLAQQKTLHIENLKTAKEYIFKDGESYRFVYIPIARKKHIPVRDFVLKLISAIHVRDERLLNFAKELRKIRDVQKFVEHLEKFLYSFDLSGEAAFDVDSEGETSVLSQQLAEDEGETTVLSRQIPEPDAEESETTVLSQQRPDEEGETTVLSRQILEPASEEGETTVLSQQRPDEEGETTVLSQAGYGSDSEEDYRFSEDLSDAMTSRTAFLQDSSFEAETTILTSQPVQMEQSVAIEDREGMTLFLIRSSTGERVPVEITPFTIGKDRASVDYALSDDSVSRRHATIVYEDGSYYIMDNQSTNGTMIEGIRLQAFEKVELGNGYIVSLGSESFQARLERR